MDTQQPSNCGGTLRLGAVRPCTDSSSGGAMLDSWNGHGGRALVAVSAAVAMGITVIPAASATSGLRAEASSSVAATANSPVGRSAEHSERKKQPKRSIKVIVSGPTPTPFLAGKVIARGPKWIDLTTGETKRYRKTVTGTTLLKNLPLGRYRFKAKAVSVSGTTATAKVKPRRVKVTATTPKTVNVTYRYASRRHTYVVCGAGAADTTAIGQLVRKPKKCLRAQRGNVQLDLRGIRYKSKWGAPKVKATALVGNSPVAAPERSTVVFKGRVGLPEKSRCPKDRETPGWYQYTKLYIALSQLTVKLQTNHNCVASH